MTKSSQPKEASVYHIRATVRRPKRTVAMVKKGQVAAEAWSVNAERSFCWAMSTAVQYPMPRYQRVYRAKERRLDDGYDYEEDQSRKTGRDGVAARDGVSLSRISTRVRLTIVVDPITAILILRRVDPYIL